MVIPREIPIPVRSVLFLRSNPKVLDKMRKGIPTHIKSFERGRDCSTFKVFVFTRRYPGTANATKIATLLSILKNASID